MLKQSEINKTSKLILIINRSEIVRAQRLHEQRILMKNYNAKQVVEKQKNSSVERVKERLDEQERLLFENFALKKQREDEEYERTYV